MVVGGLAEQVFAWARAVLGEPAVLGRGGAERGLPEAFDEEAIGRRRGRGIHVFQEVADVLQDERAGRIVVGQVLDREEPEPEDFVARHALGVGGALDVLGIPGPGSVDFIGAGCGEVHGEIIRSPT
jgi:hypothetical protein